MIPHRFFFLLMATWLVAALLTAFNPHLLYLWQYLGLILLVCALIDAALMKKIPALILVRQVHHSLPLGVWYKVKLRLENTSRYPLYVNVFDHYPTQCDMQGLPFKGVVLGKSALEFSYQILPQQRGEMTFSPCQILIRSPLHFWKKNYRIGPQEKVRVYPNFAAVARYTLLATENRLAYMGIRKKRKRGEGLEFHQLREYYEGDSLRQIDWKATSRLKKLISKEYQEESDQQIIFLLDCGRRMITKDGELSHFDHSLNAVLLLSYVALRQGDAVGFMAFSGENRWLPPHKGAHTINKILNHLYDLHPSYQTPDYSQAVTRLLSKLKKRALIILVSNIRDEDVDDLIPALKLLRQKHLLLVASLHETVIEEVLKSPVDNLDDALRVAATRLYQIDRQHSFEILQSHRIPYLDTIPEQFPIALVNKYLDIKLSGNL